MILKLQIINTMAKAIRIKAVFHIYHGLFIPLANKLKQKVFLDILYAERASFYTNRFWAFIIS